MRFIFFIYIIFLAACNNSAKDAEKKKWDSISQVIERETVELNNTTDSLYDQLGTVSNDIPLLRKDTKDFYAYLNDLKGDFQKYCTGDRDEPILESTWEDSVLTNDFFISKEHAYDLRERMNLVHNSLKKYATDSLKAYVDGTFNLLKTDKEKEHFATGYFQGRPPIIAIGNLMAMEREIRNIENKVLLNITSNHILNLKNKILQNTTK